MYRNDINNQGEVLQKILENPFMSSFDLHYDFYKEIPKFGIIIDVLLK